MTVSNTVNEWNDTGDGVTTAYPFTNKIFIDSDLNVYLDGVLQGLGVDYTVTDAGDEAGGTVTFTTAPAAAVRVHIHRNVPNTQVIDLPAGGPMPAESIEDGLDRRTIISQQLEGDISRSIRYLETDTDLPSGELPTLSTLLGGKILGFHTSTGAPTPIALSLAPLTTSYLTPEQFGTVGDGITDDTTAIDAAILQAVGTGQELRGDPSKTYYLASSTALITGSLIISDMRFKAPNGVLVLDCGETWAAENATVTSLTSTVIKNSTVTQVLLTSTTGLAVGDWVAIGSTTDTFPGQGALWFEAAEIVALVANTSISLHRRLLGEESGALSANLRLQRQTDFTLTARRIYGEADGNVLTTGQGGRTHFIRIRGGRDHLLQDCGVDAWWQRLIKLESCVKTRINGLHWNTLPDIPTGEEAFGYAVHEEGSSFGTSIVGMQGGRCRHAYTTGVGETTYSSATPWEFGFPAMSAIKASTVIGSVGASFDTHGAGHGITFSDCLAITNVSQPDSPNARGFNNRAYRTKFLNCSVRGSNHGFSDNSGNTDWTAALAPNIVEYQSCSVAGLEGDAFQLQGDGSSANTTVRVSDFSVSNVFNGFHLDGTNKFAGSLVISDFETHELADTAILDDGGEAAIEVHGALLRYTDQVDANAPIRVNVVGGGSWHADDVKVMKRALSDPNGLVRVGVAATDVPLTVGRITWDLGNTFPFLSPSSEAGATVTTTLLKRHNLFEDDEGNVARALKCPTFENLRIGATKVITGIRADACRITIELFNVSIGGGDDIHLIVNPATSFASTYHIANAGVAVNGSGTEFLLATAVLSSDQWSGRIVLNRIDSSNDRWGVVTNLRESTGTPPRIITTIGTVLLSGPATGFTIKPSAADNFDGAGSMSYMVE